MALIQSKANAKHSVSSFTVVLDSIPLFENALFVGVFYNQGSGTATLSYPGATFTRRLAKVSGSFTVEIWECTGMDQHAGMKTLTVTPPIATGPCGAVVMEFDGSINTFNVSNSNSGTSTTPSTGSATTTQTPTIAVGFLFYGPNNATANGSASPLTSITNGWTNQAEARATRTVGFGKSAVVTEWMLAGLYKSVSGTGAQSTGGTISNPIPVGNIPWIGAIAAYYSTSQGTAGACVKWTADNVYQSAIANAIYGAGPVNDGAVTDTSTYIEELGTNSGPA